MTFQDALDAFFLTEDQDAFAQSQGYADREQMCYYEDREESAMTDRETEEFVAREEAIARESHGVIGYIAPPPVELMKLHECQNLDSREVYDDTDWSGVY